MANNLIFPIGFDLDKGIEKAGKDWESGLANKLEQRLAKRPISVKMTLDVKGLEKLEDVKKRLAQLKIEPLTAENKQAIKELTKELNTLVKSLNKLSNLKGIEMPELQRAKAAKLAKEVEQADEKLRLQQERVRQSQERLTLAQQRGEQQAQKLSKAYGTQHSYLGRLLQRMAIYASFGAIGNFVKQLKEATAQFELQRISLGAILQSQEKADLLFGRLKTQALQSPATLMDLTKYTKQLAAYKIGYDELFDTMKKLTDVSVGLSVSMDRVVLAYGQVRATGHLRASEIRQFTEMGVPIVEELAAKLTKMNGELITSADVMDMVSKRMISFDMVKDVFDDMTGAGGIFFNMQEKQADSLYGVYQKLSDAYQIMLAKIGNGGLVNSALKGIAEGAIYLTKHVEGAAAALGTFVALSVFAVKSGNLIKKGQARLAERTAAVTAATQKQTAADNALTLAENRLNAATTAYNKALATGNANKINAARASLDLARANHTQAQSAFQAARAETAHAQALLNKAAKGKVGMIRQQLGASIMSFGKSMLTMGAWGLAIAGISALVGWFTKAWAESDRLNKKLREIKQEYENTASGAVRNFKSLADAAVNAADGSEKQRKALEELQRTYGDILPEQDLQIEKLRAMKGNYDELTQAIRENAAMEAKAKSLAALNEEFEERNVSHRKDAKKALKGYELNDAQIERILTNIRAYIESGEAKNRDEALRKALEDESLNRTYNTLSKDQDIINYTQGLIKQREAIKDLDDEYLKLTGNLGAFTDAFADAKARTNNFGNSASKARTLLSLLLGKLNMSGAANSFNDGLDFMSDEFWEKIDSNIESADRDIRVALTNLRKATYKELQNLFSVSENTNLWKRIGTDEGERIGYTPTGLLFISNNEKLHAYDERLKEEREEVKKLLEQGNINQEELEAYGESVDSNVKTLEGLQKKKEWLDAMILRIGIADKKKGGGSSKKDPYVELIKNRITYMKDFNSAVAELKKTMADGEAIYHTQQNMYTRGAALGINSFAHDGSIEDYQKWLEDTMEEVRRKIVGLGGDAWDLGAYQVITITTTDKQIAAYQDLLRDLLKVQTDIDTDYVSKQAERVLARLAEQISRSKEAKEFYEKMLGQSGDAALAEMLTRSIYGGIGEGLYSKQKSQIERIFASGKDGVDIDLSGVFDDANERIDWVKLGAVYDKHSEDLVEKNRKTAEQMVKDGQKASAAQVQQWANDLRKAQDFADKRVELAKRTRAEVAKLEVLRDAAGTDAERSLYQKMIDDYKAREDKEAAKMEYDAFKKGGLYSQIFGDLDNTSKQSLELMRKRLRELKDEWKNLSPTELKELQSRLRQLDKQIAQRNPFAAIGAAVKKYRELLKDGRSRKGDAEAAEAAEAARVAAYEAMLADNSEENIKAYKAAEAAADAAAAMLQDWTDLDGMAENIGKGISDYRKELSEAAKEARGLMEAFGAAETTLEMFDEIIDGAGNVMDGLQGIGDALVSFAKGGVQGFMGGITGIIGAAAGLLQGVFGLATAGAVKAANDEIERQEKALKRLEYAYDRLNAAAERAFGGEWIVNYNAQLANLEAQAQAYQKQIDAERSKGKRADEEALEDYKDSYRETMDEIAEMRGAVAEQMLGTDLTSAARDFASAWLDAYIAFDDTAAALEERMGDMMQNLIIETMLSKVMEQALQPAFDMIDGMSGNDWRNGSFWSRWQKAMSSAVANADAGAQAVMAYAKQAGLDLNQLAESEASGIAKNVSNASSEEINALTAGINTQNYYMSYVPQIYALLQAMNGGAAATPTDAGTLQAQAMTHYAAIEANTAATVRELQGLASLLGRVISYKGSKWGVSTH